MGRTRRHWNSRAGVASPSLKKEAEKPFGPILTVAEVARYLRVHPSTIYRLVKRKDLPAFKVGRDWRFDFRKLSEWQFDKSLETWMTK